MTEENEKAPAPATPAVPRKVIGADAEAALNERNQQARGEQLVYTFRGEEYVINTPLPAAVPLRAALSQRGEGDAVELIETIRAAFAGDDGDRMVDALLDVKVAVPADMTFLGQVLGDVVEVTSNRPSTN